MVHVHHTKQKQAMSLGCYISITDDNRVRIFWPQRSVELFGASVDEAINEMRAVQGILHTFVDYKVVTNGGSKVIVTNQLTGEQMNIYPEPPSVLLAMLEAGEDEWIKPDQFNATITPMIETSDRISGIPKSGKVAYQEGVPASDCPYLEDDPEFGRWNAEWDEAADQVSDEENPKPETVGSVITNRYRAHYLELGHPTHCGDELANLLNSICRNKGGTNLHIFEMICAANGVNLTKYNRTSKGWQGRLRMTGRNLLAKRIVEQGGKLMMPSGFGQEHYQLSADWVQTAGIKFKPKG